VEGEARGSEMEGSSVTEKVTTHSGGRFARDPGSMMASAKEKSIVTGLSSLVAPQL